MIHESKGKNVNEADLAYDTELRIFFIDVSGRRWDTEAHLNAHFDRLIAAWKKWSGVKCDMCAGYAGFQFDMTALGLTRRPAGNTWARTVSIASCAGASRTIRSCGPRSAPSPSPPTVPRTSTTQKKKR